MPVAPRRLQRELAFSRTASAICSLRPANRTRIQKLLLRDQQPESSSEPRFSEGNILGRKRCHL